MARARKPANLETVRGCLRHAAERLDAAGVVYGHGLRDAGEEAELLLAAALGPVESRLCETPGARVPAAARERLLALIARRIDERIPAAYLAGRIRLAGHEFIVDERTIVPRSFIAELIPDGLLPWLRDPGAVRSALDLCTGSGCLAILLAHAYPNARVDATDVSDAALEVAALNVAAHGLAERVSLVRADLFAAPELAGRRYDLIVSNPPYVARASMEALPAEYRHEPALALAAGEDGLDIVRRILRDAPAHLAPGGVLVVEIGQNFAAVARAFPGIRLTWLETSAGVENVFLVQ